jgi:CHAD domain-containing protein
VYRFENAWIRDTARFVSDVRASAVLVEGAEEIRDLYGPLLVEGTFDEVVERLRARRDHMQERAMEDPKIVPRVVSNLERARGRYQSWPTDPDARTVYGIGLRHSYQAVGPGVRATHTRGRQEMVAAYREASPASFHRWRKSVKYLQHQLEILTPLWPEVMIGMAITLNRIADLLGQDHDLAELLQLLADRPDICPNPVERSMMSALVAQRRSDLQTASRILGRRIYTESPASLDVRLGAYWESMELAHTTKFASLSA